MLNIKHYTIMINNKISELIKVVGLAFPYKKRMATYRMLEKMTGEPASLQINEAIEELRLMEVNKELKTPLWYVYDDVNEQMRSSDMGFAGSMSKYIPQQDTMIIAASEQDDITVGFSTVIENNKKSYAMKQAYKQAIAYPTFLLCTLLAVIYYFSTELIPVMAENIPAGAKVTATSSFLILLANTFYWWFSILIFMIVGIAGFVLWALPNFVGKYRKYLEDIPPFNMYRLMVGCGFLFALNSLQRAGYPALEALEQMLSTANPYLKIRIEILMDLMADGMDIGESLIYSGLNFPDKQVVRELAVQIKYSEDNALEILSSTLAEDGLETIKAQAKILNTLFTLFVFGCIGFLYFAVFGLGMELGKQGT